MNSNFVYIHSTINILQNPGSTYRTLGGLDYSFNDLEKDLDFHMPLKDRGNPATVSTPAMIALIRGT